MKTQLITTTAVLACFAMVFSADAEELILIDTSSSGMLTWDAPLGTSDLVDPLAENYFEELSNNGASEADLQLNASPSTSVPEPSTLGLLALGGLLLTRRRR